MATPVRPSSFQMAEKCERAPYLSTKYPESNAATEFGSSVDDQVTRALRDGQIVLAEGEELHEETKAILAWVAATFPRERWEYFVQRKVKLMDPEDGEVLTEGTPDLMALNRNQKFLCVVDWKKIGQWWAGHLAPPDQNLQQLIYLVAGWLELSRELGTEIESGQITLACFDARGVQPKTSQEIKEDRCWEVIAKVKAQPLVDLDKPEPQASKGKHCDHCYGRMHCSAYLLPEKEGMPAALVPFSRPGALTAETAAQGLEWLEKADAAIKQAKELRDQVEASINAFTAKAGPIVVGDRQYGPKEKTGSRRGPTLGELETNGHADMIKPGKTSIVYDWMPAGAPVPTVPSETEKPEKPAKRTKKTPAATLVKE